MKKKKKKKEFKGWSQTRMKSDLSLNPFFSTYQLNLGQIP